MFCGDDEIDRVLGYNSHHYTAVLMGVDGDARTVCHLMTVIIVVFGVQTDATHHLLSQGLQGPIVILLRNLLKTFLLIS